MRDQIATLANKGGRLTRKRTVSNEIYCMKVDVGHVRTEEQKQSLA